MKINLAIIGAGRIGKVHALAINNSKIANLVYIYDPDEEIAKKFSVEFNCIVSNIDNIKKDKQIEMKESDKNLFGINKLNIKRSSIPAITPVSYTHLTLPTTPYV